MKLNVGSGEFGIVGEGWVNLDADPSVPADIHATVPPLPFVDGELDEIWACHFLEHLDRPTAKVFLGECFRCLKPGGKLGVVVPDTREIVSRYLAGAIDQVEYPVRVYWPIADLDSLCVLFLYSTAQASAHRWSYDARTLYRIMAQAGFDDFTPVDRYTDPRLGSGRWYQCGWDCVKPGGAA